MLAPVEKASRYLCLGAVVLMAACQGSWADQTVVHLAPLGKTGVKGLAIVSIGRTCDDDGHCRLEGSYIMTQLTSDSFTSLYRMILAEGDCARPSKTGILLSEGNGDVLNTQGASKHVDIPIISLTGGNYVIVVQNRAHVAVACGVIHRAGVV